MKSLDKNMQKNITKIITANEAAAIAAKLSEIQIVSAYPITPQSPVVEKLIEYHSQGQLKAEIVTVESEHSAITVCISASTAGARVFTASCANGLALMHEQLHWAAGSRLPIVMAIPNRAVAAPWSILNDQQDSISQRDTGWIQIYCKNNQEVLDSIIQAYKIAEKVMIPTMVCYDGYVLSHTLMPVQIPSSQQVKKFLPSYKPHTVLSSQDPQNINPVTLANPRKNAQGVLCHSYYEIRYLLQEAHQKAIKVVETTDREFKKDFGRQYPLLDQYRCQNAKLILITMGSLASEALEAVDLLREKGLKVGVIHLRLYRPFPAKAIAKAIAKTSCQGIIVIEKNVSYGYEGALCSDLKGALFELKNEIFIHPYIAGLGGRDVNYSIIAEALQKSYKYLSKEKKKQTKNQEWLDCRI